MTGSTVFEKLLCYGIFPERLERIFSSKAFGSWVISNNELINIDDKSCFSIISYKLTRNDNSPRFIGIPHPLGYLRVCRLIKNNWTKIASKFENEHYLQASMSALKSRTESGRLFSIQSYELPPEMEELSLKKQMAKRYFVHVDISNYYHSIYTHSISWALVGRDEAKKNRFDERKWFNQLDKSVRNLQNGESIGIPIGSDVSAMISEIILSTIDERLRNYNYLRVLDDYECYCSTKEEAEKFIRELSLNLEEYRLRINTGKTKILSLPQTIDDDWVRILRRFTKIKRVDKYTKHEVLDYIDLATDLFQKYPNESPVRYAAEKLTSFAYTDFESYKLVLRYILNLSFLFPYILDICEEIVSVGVRNFKTNQKEILTILSANLNEILNEHVKYGRSDVSTWGIFIAIKYDIKIRNFSKLTADILKTNDCVPTLMAYLYSRINNTDKNIFLNKLKKIDLNEWWLFVYEVKRLEGLKFGQVEVDKMLKFNITFLDDVLNRKLGH